MLKIVKNKDFKVDKSKKRSDSPDSPLRYPMHVHMTENHHRRIEWLYYENYKICEEYISAKLLYAISKLKHKQKEKLPVNLKEYKAIEEALSLWDEVNCFRDYYSKTWREYGDDWYSKYHYIGDEELELEEEE